MLALFANFEARSARNGSKRTKKRILYMCLRNQFCIHIRVRTFYFPKKGQNPCIVFHSSTFSISYKQESRILFLTPPPDTMNTIVLRCFKTPLKGTVTRDLRPEDYYSFCATSFSIRRYLLFRFSSDTGSQY